jgi:hypothetical protein
VEPVRRRFASTDRQVTDHQGSRALLVFASSNCLSDSGAGALPDGEPDGEQFATLAAIAAGGLFL